MKEELTNKLRSEIGYYVRKVIKRDLNEKELEELDFFIREKIFNNSKVSASQMEKR